MTTETTMTLTKPEPLLLDRIRALKTPARELLEGLHEAFCDAILIPNEYLPKRLHGKRYENEGVRRYGRSVSDLMRAPKISKAEQKRIDDEERAIEKSLRIESYADDEANKRELRYHEDELRLYRNQITFANLIGLEFE